jgi:hypothetical protein
MKSLVLNGSERTDGCFTAAFFQTQLGGAVAVQHLAVAMEQGRTYLLARTSGKTTARPPVFVCRSKELHTLWI